ncbi:MAG: abortive infection system antitoxin AbiGi family protein [Sulfuricurvum sp.]|jgi:hypothetical protein|uniref:abortive infection system antitoxin AbiGi family protein n=1 Tax=Sulfuricurvum sp. TaxID=2025608 RepID=UPI0025EF22A4|nr:abortive infection system antitoxin AbiGi family protein [Sulfuricurvum sp.]MCK9372429.1 abortive infection system antitoxin AbiGi family protein [Sulfuricurvum sp.]
MGLSSSSIIHFTASKDSLKGILKNNFKIKYCTETIEIAGKERAYAAPMVSFCDIPLSEVKKHIDSYGSYGIGLTKEWAIRQKLNPVIYIEGNSYFSENILELLRSTEKNKEASANALTVYSYIKNYENTLQRKGKDPVPNYRFSDEREWRYVPQNTDKNEFTLSKEVYEDEETKDAYDFMISDIFLTFEPNDIKYIIIKDDSEIREFFSFLRDVKGKYSSHDVDRLTTRILTTEQIKEDF